MVDAHRSEVRSSAHAGTVGIEIIIAKRTRAGRVMDERHAAGLTALNIAEVRFVVDGQVHPVKIER